MTKYCQRKYKNVILVGRSLGTGVTVGVAHQLNWQSPIVLVSPYRSIGQIATDSCLAAAIGMFPTESRIGQLSCPVRLIHGTKDRLIPIEHSYNLFKLLKHPLIPIYKTVGHNDIVLAPEDLSDIVPALRH